MNQPAIVLSVKYCGRTYPVASLDEAADKWEQFRDEAWAAGGTPDDTGGGLVVRNSQGKPVGYISANGRIWTPENDRNFDSMVRVLARTQGR